MNIAVWLSYDLGLKGDYESLYEWLDSKDAIECGDSLAFFKIEKKQNMLEAIKKDLKKHVNFGPKDRVYLILPSESKSGSTVGKFIFGRRKQSPWEGHALKKIIGDEFDRV